MTKIIRDLILLLIIFKTVVLAKDISENPDDWLDPYDMTPSKEYLQYSNNPSLLHLQLTQNEKVTQDSQQATLTKMYYRRMVNMLLNSVHEDLIDKNEYSGYLFFKLNFSKYELLKSFADGLNTQPDLEKIDEILMEILNKPTSAHIQQYLETGFHKILNIILSREGIISIIIVTYIYIIYKMIHANFYSLQVVKFLLLNFIIFDFVFTWISLYQKEKSKEMMNIAKSLEFSENCNLNSMSTWHILLNLFYNEDKCLQHYDLKYRDIFYKVTPGTVLTEMFARTIQYPAKSIGTAFGDICNGIYSALPFPINLIILIVCLPFFCLLICITLFTLLGKSIKFNFFNLFSFSFGEETNKSSNEDRISGNNLKSLLDLSKKSSRFIEEIPVESISEESQVKVRRSKAILASKNEEGKIDDQCENCCDLRKLNEKSEVGAGDNN